MSLANYDAIIIGAGPNGLAAAIELARSGVECLLIERRAEMSSHPRATTVSLRTMEIVRRTFQPRSRTTTSEPSRNSRSTVN